MRFHRILSLLLLAACLPACTAYHETVQPLAELTAPPKPAQRLRITREGGIRTYLDVPKVINDSLRGYDARSSGAEVAIPLTDIRTVEVAKPTLLVIGIVVGALAVAVGILWVVMCC